MKQKSLSHVIDNGLPFPAIATKNDLLIVRFPTGLARFYRYEVQKQGKSLSWAMVGRYDSLPEAILNNIKIRHTCDLIDSFFNRRHIALTNYHKAHTAEQRAYWTEHLRSYQESIENLQKGLDQLFLQNANR